MSERQQRPYDSIARSWLALVERRQQSIIELWKSGRWRHYYTHAQFLDEMGKVLHLRNQWARLAGVPVSDQIGLPQIGLQQKDLQQINPQQSLKQNDRHSQNAGAREVKVRVARRAWAAPVAGLGDFGGCSGASLTRWT
jgi:hypothetical protein